MENLLQHLKELGFNNYESKVYLSLLKHNPATGYEVSVESGIPQARAYDTLKTLAKRKIVVASGEKPIYYIPISSKELLKRCERSFKSSIKYLNENLSNLYDNYVEPILNIRGTTTIFTHVIELIENAKQEIFIEIWNEDFEIIKDSLKEAYDRGIDIKIVGYNGINADFGLIYQHGLGNEIEKSLGGRCIVLSVDGSEGIVGTLSGNQKDSHAIWTKNPGVMLVVKEVIVHDMFLLDVESKLGDQLNQIYGENMISLREKILGKNFKFSAH